ncbi:MAG TPA: lipopolysaccharide heptosyltransferase II [Bryobacteraceae bacterium]|nr:lipopolysaccharide heptosyltransferase II [Bryobacteraceae bacterium]
MELPLMPGRILVRAPNWLGDAVMSLPALRALRLGFPGAHIAVHARPSVADLYTREGFASEVLLCHARPNLWDWRGRRQAAAELAARNFDTALLLPNSFDSALLVWMARIPRRIGYRRDFRGPLLSEPVPPPRRGEIPPHQQHYYLELIKRASLAGQWPPDGVILLDRIEEARQAGLRRWGERGVESSVIGVSPGAAFGGAKRWPAERFAEAAARLAKLTGWTVAIFGSARERALGETVARTAAGLGARALNLAGTTSLAEFIELAAACRLFLANDSGAMHVASALGVPTVAVFGATDPEATGPAGPSVRVVREPVSCSPCLLRECPIDHRCMRAVSADLVVQGALKLIS